MRSGAEKTLTGSLANSAGRVDGATRGGSQRGPNGFRAARAPSRNAVANQLLARPIAPDASIGEADQSPQDLEQSRAVRTCVAMSKI
jgi:hypothetical protein